MINKVEAKVEVVIKTDPVNLRNLVDRYQATTRVRRLNLAGYIQGLNLKSVPESLKVATLGSAASSFYL